MNIATAFLLFFAGCAFNEAHNYIRRKGEKLARQNGYKQGLREDERRREVRNELREYREPEQAEPIALPDEFFEKVRQEGGAAIRMKRGKQEVKQ